MENISPEPRDSFEVAPAELDRARAEGEFLGIFHSHPAGQLQPSFSDMETQIAFDLPFYVCTLSIQGGFMDYWAWGDQLPTPPLLNRDFRSGVTDCYSLVRHYHAQVMGNILPDFPRDPDWWENPHKANHENPLLMNMTEAAFMVVDPHDMQAGDGILLALRPEVGVVHCGVYTGDGLFLHHLYGRVSRRDPLAQWWRFVHYVVRVKDAHAT